MTATTVSDDRPCRDDGQRGGDALTNVIDDPPHGFGARAVGQPASQCAPERWQRLRPARVTHRPAAAEPGWWRDYRVTVAGDLESPERMGVEQAPHGRRVGGPPGVPILMP